MNTFAFNVEFGIDKVATNDVESSYSLVITILISSKYIKNKTLVWGKLDLMIKFDNNTGEKKRHLIYTL